MSNVELKTMCRVLVLLILTAFGLSACGGGGSIYGPGPGGGYKVGRPYQINGVWYYPSEDTGYNRIGLASWYGRDFHGSRTANGERFDRNRLTAAHPTLPMPVIVEVTNLDNGRTVLLRVNDRGPFRPGRIIDVSQAAARELGFEKQGVTRVRVRYVGRADNQALALKPPRTDAPLVAGIPHDARIVVD